jgi:hypothetical protein
MLTGRTPFEGKSYPEMLVAHLTERVPPPSRWNASVTPGLDAIVASATEIDRDRRILNMNELLRALGRPEQHLAQRAAHARTMVATPSGVDGVRRPKTTLSTAAAEVSAPVPRVPPPQARGRAGVWVGLGAVALAAIGGLGYALLKSDSPSVATPAAAVKPGGDKASDDWIEVTVDSNPPGATVKHRGEEDTTPVALRVKKGQALHLEFELDGYKPFEQDVPTDRSRAVTVELRPEAKAAPVHAPAPAPKPAVAKPAKPRGKGSSKPPAQPGSKPDDIYMPKSLQF